MTAPVAIVGAGLAGLAAARHLTAARVPCTLLEASDGVGGRVRTDAIDGFLVDRGFQVLLTAYPECRAVLDYAALDLCAFEPGAVVRAGEAWHRLADPFRRPGPAVASLLDRLGSWRDKAAVLRLRQRALEGSLDELFARPATSTRTVLEAFGFSADFTTAFLEPWLGGIFLGRDLATSSRMLDFVMRMMAQGDTAIPARGMGAIPAQLAGGLPPGTVQLHRRVVALEEEGVRLDDGQLVPASDMIIATEGDTAATLLGLPAPTRPRSAISLAFAAPAAPWRGRDLLLNGEGRGPINSLVVMSELSAGVAPASEALVTIALIDDHPEGDEALERTVRQQASTWFGASVATWRLLRVHRIRYAQPDQLPDDLHPVARPVRLRAGRYVAGDHRETATLHGALHSGRRAAEALLRDRGAA
ncbi:MAG: FAD-dependent oxidoreductase [Gemmatimonadales bacterium]|nr:FAD-dependent oxidoreductase [Gemmatimonadales bacterium]